MKSTIILAAGKGTRMKSSLPKVMHKVCDKTMLENIIDQAKEAGSKRIVTVIGYQGEMIQEQLQHKTEIAWQREQLGTGHAVMQAQQLAQEKGKTLVINGDAPCLQKETLAKMFAELDHCEMVVVSTIEDDPKAYGRVIRNASGKVEKIVEFKDCTEAEKKGQEINSGIYGFNNEVLFNSISKLKANNAQKEYYITDLVEIINQDNLRVNALVIDNKIEVMGCNDQQELAFANEYVQQRINNYWLAQGVVMVDPKTVYISQDAMLQPETTIYPNVVIKGKSIIASNCVIGPNTIIEEAVIADNCIIEASKVEKTTVDQGSKIGPFEIVNNKERK